MTNISIRKRQHGAVAILVGISIFVLLGFLGLVIDGGRLFIAKTELQNAMDACALAAVRELDGSSQGITRAVDSGMTVGGRNRIDFQSQDVPVVAEDITFSAQLDGPFLSAADITPSAAKYVKCSRLQDGFLPFVIQVLGVGEQSVAASAVAVLDRAQLACGIPLGVCKKDPADICPGGEAADPYGHCKGKWYSGRFDAGGASTGSFNWIDFTPPAGGASELTELVEGEGMCDLEVGQCVGQTGIAQSLEKAWNSRFGVYHSSYGSSGPTTAPPDFTGYSYCFPDADCTAAGNCACPAPGGNWPTRFNAFDGSDVSNPSNPNDRIDPNFNEENNPNSARSQFLSYGGTVDTVAEGNTITGLNLNQGSNSVSTHGVTGTHGTAGADRRLVTAPIIDCTQWSGGAPGCGPQQVRILDWACVLMLHPISNPQQFVNMEYRGLASEEGNPCATSGLGGGTIGPFVPVLVQ